MADASRPLRLIRLELRNWRNFKSAELDLEPRTFLVGPNAAGKSNLLDAIRFLHDIVAVGGGFEDAVTRRGGVSRLRCLAARRNSVRRSANPAAHLRRACLVQTKRSSISDSRSGQRSASSGKTLTWLHL